MTERIKLTASAYSLNTRPDGGNTLDQAYGQGGPGADRTIIADAGAVDIAGPDGLTVEGNVGIGTTPSQDKLDVQSSIAVGKIGNTYRTLHISEGGDYNGTD